MKTTFLTILLFTSFILPAQQADSLSSGGKKNQIYVNLLPVLVPAFGAVPEVFSLRFGYERKVSQKWNLRSNFSFNSLSDLRSHCDYNVVSYSDSFMIREYEMRYGTPEFRLGLGARRLWIRKGITWYAGMDMYAGLSKNTIQGVTSNWRLDSTATSSSGEEVWIPESSTSLITRWVETKNFDLGVHPFFGAERNLGKRFSLSAQFGFDLFWRDTYFKRHYPEQVTYHSYSFNMNIAGMVNELALRYRF